MSSRVDLAENEDLDFRHVLEFGSRVEFETRDGEERSGLVDAVNADAFQVTGTWYSAQEVVWLRHSRLGPEPSEAKVFVGGESTDFKRHLRFGSNIEFETTSGQNRAGVVDAVRADAFLVDGQWYSGSDVRWFREVYSRDYRDIAVVLGATTALALGLVWWAVRDLGGGLN